VSFALVFSATGGVTAAGLLPRVAPLVETIPRLNALISVTAIGTILYGVVGIRRGRVRRHRLAMLARLALFIAFLLLYLYRVSLEGPAAFRGSESVYRLVYLPTLAVHVSLAVVCVPLLYYVALLALTHGVAELPETPHPRVGRAAATLWLVFFSLGLAVYGMVYLVY
jgi:Predicted membrane protein